MPVARNASSSGAVRHDSFVNYMSTFASDSSPITSATKPLTNRLPASSCTPADLTAASDAYVAESVVTSIRANLDNLRGTVPLGSFVKQQLSASMVGSPDITYTRAIDANIALSVALWLGFTWATDSPVLSDVIGTAFGIVKPPSPGTTPAAAAATEQETMVAELRKRIDALEKQPAPPAKKVKTGNEDEANLDLDEYLDEIGGPASFAARASSSRAPYPSPSAVRDLSAHFSASVYPTATTRKLVNACQDYLSYVVDQLKVADNATPAPSATQKSTLDRLYRGEGGLLDQMNLRATGQSGARHREKQLLVACTPPGMDTRGFCVQRRSQSTPSRQSDPPFFRSRGSRDGDARGSRFSTPRSFGANTAGSRPGRANPGPGLPPDLCGVCHQSTWRNAERRCVNPTCRRNTHPRGQGGRPEGE